MAFANDPIKHVVVLMLENRSFDHVLGDLARVQPARGIEGVTPGNYFSNPNPATHQSVLQHAGATPQLPKKLDPKHEFEDVATQIGNAAPYMQGFVTDAVNKLQSADLGAEQIGDEIMAFFGCGDYNTADALPAIHALARNFLVCDNWFSSVPGPTWPNRFFALCGTSGGFLKMPESAFDVGPALRPYTMDTIFNRVLEGGRTCRIYHHGVGLSMLLRSTWKIANAYEDFQGFLDATDPDKPGTLPDLSFIEPDYFGEQQNDQHPPSNILRGDALVAQVYNAIRRNESLWSQTLLVVLYDEHGGFFDHVPPKSTQAPDDKVGDQADFNFGFTQLGVRVPALLVSPYAPVAVDKTLYDHTSLLAYLCRKWDLPPLGDRCDKANSFEARLLAQPRAEATPVSIDSMTLPPQRDLDVGTDPTDSQKHIAWAVDYIAAYIDGENPAPATRALEENVVKGAPEVKAKFGRILERLKSIAPPADAVPPSVAGAATFAPEGTIGARPGAALFAKAVASGEPLRVFMVHGVGHGDSPEAGAWKDQWMSAFRASAQKAGYPDPGGIEFVFASFDAIFDKYPLDAWTIAHGIFILGRDAASPPPGWAPRELRTLDFTETVRWTAGMVVQWIENPSLRDELNDALLTQLKNVDPHLVCAHSLGSLACYDLFRRLVATKQIDAINGRNLLTFGSQIANPAVQGVFGGRIAPVYDADSGAGIDQWFHLYNPHDHVFTCPLPGGDERTHSLDAPFDIPGDLLNHDGAAYLANDVTANAALPHLLPSATVATPRQLAPAVMARAIRSRRAVLVGINEYPNPEWHLNGCVNDVYLVSAVLQECGYPPESIRVLTDQRATRAALLERLDWLADGVQEGDERVFFYSGHGAQMPVYGAAGEPERLDETLVPVDFDWSVDHAFRDKEFAQYYAHLPYGCTFLTMLDCCHAGGMTRGALRVRGIDPPDDVRHRTLKWNPEHQMWVARDFVEKPVDAHDRPVRSFSLAPDAEHEFLDHRQRTLGVAAARRPPSPSQFEQATKTYDHLGPFMPILMYAARQDQLAAEYEHGSVSQGAFTFCLVKNLRDKKHRRAPPTFKSVVTDVRLELRALGYQQDPEILGPSAKLAEHVPLDRWRTERP